MVRENLRILINSKTGAVNLSLVYDWWCGSAQLQMLPTLQSSPGLLDQCLKGIWKSIRWFPGTSLWSWSANTRNNFAYEQSAVPGWHRSPRSDCWALGEDRAAAGFAQGQQRQLWQLTLGVKPAWNITPDILTGDQLKPSILPLYPAKIAFFLLNQPLLGCF